MILFTTILNNTMEIVMRLRTMRDRVCEWVQENHTLYEGVSGYLFAKDLRKAIEK